MRSFRILFFLFCQVTLQALGQDCNLSLKGLVEDNEGTRLAGAAVWIESLKLGAASQADGTFVHSELCPGTYELTIKFIGYEDQRITVRIPTQKPIVITLKPSVQILHDVVVEGEHVQQHGLAQSVSILSTEELDANKGKPLGELLKQLPGVNVLMTGPAIFKPVIHGLHSQRILILNNGIRQEGQQWGVEHAPEIDTYIASEIEVVKGAEAVRYGADAVGGVVIINTPPLHLTSALGGELNAAVMSNNRMGVFSGTLEGGFKKWNGWGWRLQGTVKKGGDFHAANYNLSNTGTRELNFSGTLGFKKEDRALEIYFSSFNTELGILRSAHTGNLDDLQSSIEKEQPWYVADFTYDINNPKQKIDHQLLKLKAHKDIGPGRLNVLYGAQYNQRKEFDIRRGGRSDKPALSLQLFSHVLDVSLDHTLGAFTGSVGVNGTLKDNTNEPGTGIKPLVPDYNQYSGGIFIIEKLRKKKWLFEAGARYDHQYLQVLTFDQSNILVKPVYQFDYVSATLGASYYFSEKTRFISNFGLSTRPPHVSEMYSEGLHHSTASIERGLMRKNGELVTDQSNVKKEVSHKWINSLQVIGENLVLDISAYVNLINHYVYLRPTGTQLTIRGYFPVFEYGQTDAMLTGSDVSLQWHLHKRLSYQGKASYLYASGITHDEKLTFIPPAQLENALTYSWPKAGRWKDLYVTVSVPTALKQYRAPKTVYPEDAPNYTGDETFDFMPAPKAYTLLNLEVGTKIPVGDKELSVILSGENLLNTSYRNYMNRLRYYADDTGRNIMLRLKYNFHSHKDL